VAGAAAAVKFMGEKADAGAEKAVFE